MFAVPPLHDTNYTAHPSGQAARLFAALLMALCSFGAVSLDPASVGCPSDRRWPIELVGLAERRLGLTDQVLERCRLVHRQIGKNLAINLDAGPP